MPETRLRPGISGNSACSQSDHSPCRRTNWRSAKSKRATGSAGVRVDGQFGGGDGAIPAQAVGRAFDAEGGAAVGQSRADDPAAGNFRAGFGRVAGEEGEGSVAAREVGRTHAGQRFGFAFGGRKVGRHADDLGRHAGLGKQLPEGPSGAHGMDAAAAQGDAVGTERQNVGGLDDLRHRSHRHVGRGIALHEVEDAVTAGVHAGDHGGPGHGALRRDGGGEALEIAFAAEAIEIGQRAPVVFEEHRVHAVDADNDELAAGEARDRMRAAGCHEREDEQRAGFHATASFRRSAGRWNRLRPSM